MSLSPTNDAAFADDVLSSALPVLVEFTADWCPPCRMMMPVLQKIANAHRGCASCRSTSTPIRSLPARTAS